MNTTMNFKRRGLALFGALAMLAASFMSGPSLAAQAADAGNPNPGVIPPNSKPFGHTYGEWSNMFWQWAFSIPVHAEDGSILNPLADVAGDQTGTGCAVGQSGPVWFLAGLFNSGGTVTRNCTMPAGKGIFFPIFNVEDDNVGREPPYYTLDQLREEMEGFMQWLDGCPSCSAEVDGVPIQGVFGDGDRIGYGNPAYSVDLPEDNLYTHVGIPTPAGTVDPQISDGWYLMLAPLSAGRHTVHFATGGLDITYNLTITR